MYRLKNIIAGFKQQGGFLLVDSIVAVVVLAIGLVAIARLYMYGTDYRYRAANRQKAVQIAAERIERLKDSEAQYGGASLDDLNDVITEINKDNTVKLTDSETFSVKMDKAVALNKTTGYSSDSEVAIIKTTVSWPVNTNDHSLELYSYIITAN